jgi:hypothetical protein
MPGISYFGPSYFGRRYFSNSYYGNVSVALQGAVAIQPFGALVASGRRIGTSGTIAVSAATTETQIGKRLLKGLPSVVDVLSIFDSTAKLRAKGQISLGVLSSLSATSIRTSKGIISVPGVSTTLQNAKRVAIGSATLTDLSVVSSTAKGLKPGVIFGIQDLSNIASNAKRIAKGIVTQITESSEIIANNLKFGRTNSPIQDSSNVVTSGRKIARTTVPLLPQSSVLSVGARYRSANPFALDGFSELATSPRLIAIAHSDVASFSNTSAFAGKLQRSISDLSSSTTLTSNGKSIRVGFVSVQDFSTLQMTGSRRIATGGFVFPLSTTQINNTPRSILRTNISINDSTIVNTSGDQAHSYDGLSDLQSQTGLQVNAWRTALLTITPFSTSAVSSESKLRRIGLSNIGATTNLLAAGRETAKGVLSVQSTAQITTQAFRYRLQTSNINVQSSLIVSEKKTARQNSAIYSTSQILSAVSRIRYGLLNVVPVSSNVISNSKRLARTNSVFQSVSQVTASPLKVLAGITFITPSVSMAAFAKGMFRPKVDVLSQGTSQDNAKSRRPSFSPISSTTFVQANFLNSSALSTSIATLSALGVIGKSIIHPTTLIQNFSTLTATSRRIHAFGFNVFTESFSGTFASAKRIAKTSTPLSSFSSTVANSKRIRRSGNILATSVSSILADTSNVSRFTSSLQSTTNIVVPPKLTRHTTVGVTSSAVLANPNPKRILRTNIALSSASIITINSVITRRSGPISLQDFSNVNVVGKQYKAAKSSISTLSNLISNVRRVSRSPTSISGLSGLFESANRIARPTSNINNISGMLSQGRRVRHIDSQITSQSTLVAITNQSISLSSNISSISTTLSSANARRKSFSSIIENSDLYVEAMQLGVNVASLHANSNVNIRPKRYLKIVYGVSTIDSDTNLRVKGNLQPSPDSAVLLVGI